MNTNNKTTTTTSFGSSLDNFNLEDFKQKFIKGIKEGKPLSGSEGLLTPLIKMFLEEALESELEQHLGYKKNGRSDTGNHRNGITSKTVKSSYGSFDLSTPRDRQGSFQPEVVRKNQTILNEEIDNKIISLFGLGMSYKDVCKHIEELYGIELSPPMLTSITDKIIPLIKEWQSRPVDTVYPFVFMDAIHYKVKDDGKIVKKAVYIALGINKSGLKEILGMYLGESEGAKFWLGVLTDLQNRGLKDILIACVDNLTGFADAIESIYPQTEVQLCVIHQIRNSLKYIPYKDRKVFLKDLKKVYQAPNKEIAEQELVHLDETWSKKYGIVIKSWYNNWERLSNYFKYPENIRKIIYTTNIIEGLNRQLRKVTKTKGAFSSDMALMKQLYLASQNISEKWTMPYPNWGQILSQLAIFFENRLDLEL